MDLKDDRLKIIAGAEPPADLRILVVEDQPINQKVLEGMLAYQGLKPDRAWNGHEALAACARKDYDLIFMDSHMPGMDGCECTRRLRLRQGAHARPVIIGVTADAMNDSREDCLAAGMDGMITKPIMEKELARVISSWRRGRPGKPPHWSPTPLGATPGGAAAAWAPAPPGDRRELIDVAQLEEMNAWILKAKPGFWNHARAQFDEAYRRQSQAMREAFAAGRWREAGDAAHAYKGVCYMFGFHRMGEICGDLEAIGLGGDPARWRELMSELEAAREPSLKAWTAWVQYGGKSGTGSRGSGD